MKIDAKDYPAMRAWFAVVAPRIFPDVPADADPILALDRIEAVSMANARKGLSMAIGDVVEMTDHWNPDEIEMLNKELIAAGLHSFAMIRARFSKAIAGIVRRGRIKSESEYYLLRNAAELDPGRAQAFFGLTEKWEDEITGQAGMAG